MQKNLIIQKCIQGIQNIASSIFELTQTHLLKQKEKSLHLAKHRYCLSDNQIGWFQLIDLGNTL